MIEPVLELVDPGLGASLQDLGRRGWKRFGVPPGGALDRHGARWANLLLGNLPDAPVLELLLQGARLRALRPVELAVTGAATTVPDGPGWRTFILEPGAELSFPAPPAGVWSYVALPGGFGGERWFGSVGVFPRGGLGAALTAGTLLGRAANGTVVPHAGVGVRWLAPAQQRNYLQPPSLPVWPGPQWELFPEADRADFFARSWKVSSRSDRTGYRLEGPPLAGAASSIPSEPVLPGSIQIPPDGQPIVTQRDGPTVGGYPKLGLVNPVHLSWLSQCRPGQSIRFVPADRPEPPTPPTPGSSEDPVHAADA